jgi:Fe-S-cluster containining protein
MLDEETGLCTIYEQRPLSCKLFPLDIFAFGPGKAEWVLFNFCPSEHRNFAHPKPGQPSEFELALTIVGGLEKEFSDEILREIKEATVAVGELDIFEPHRSAVRRLKPVIRLI